MSILSGLGAIVLLVIDILAIISILGSAQTALAKLLWIILVLVLPLLGPIIWYLAGPRA